MSKPFQVQKMTFDTSRQYAVVATFRNFNKVVGRYKTKEQASKRAYYLNRKGV